MQATHTNKERLARGLRYLIFAFGLMILSPLVIHSAFKNQNHEMYLPVLAAGCFLAASAIALGFAGIRTMINAIFSTSTKSLSVSPKASSDYNQNSES